MKIEGAIFDLDGTLLDSMFIWNTIGEDYLIHRGISPRENLTEKFKSMTLLQAAQYYQSEYGLTDSTDFIVKDVNRQIAHLYETKVKIKEGVLEFLTYLQKNHVKLCIATATDRHLVEASLKNNGVLSFFDKIFTCSEVGASKESPLIYEKACSYLQTDKSHTYVFEDVLHAIKTAKKTDFNVVGIYDKYEQQNQSIIIDTADLYMRSFTEWRNYFD